MPDDSDPLTLRRYALNPTPTRAPGRKLGLADIQTDGSGLPSRLVIFGTEGIGKSSFGAAAPKPIFVMTQNETGLPTLLDAGRVPPTPHFPETMSWSELLDTIAVLTDQ